jgi:hypothetical protein
MNIRYDYYTKDATAAMEAMKAAAETSPRRESVQLSYDPADDIWNICGAADHQTLQPLFDIFEANDFTDDRYSL